MANAQDAFRLRVVDGVAELTFDLPEASVNTLSLAVMEAFVTRLETLQGDTSVRAVVLRSGKPDQFIAGAKIDFLSTLETAEAAESVSRSAQQILARVERFPKPILVSIHGTCLGGGLELALACHYRL